MLKLRQLSVYYSGLIFAKYWSVILGYFHYLLDQIKITCIIMHVTHIVNNFKLSIQKISVYPKMISFLALNLNYQFKTYFFKPLSIILDLAI